jgi:hypothetical protein
MKKIFISIVCLLFPMLLMAQVRVGDILCVQGTDTITVSPENYTSGALGVVFYVDETGQHGWALHPQVQASNIYWSYYDELPWGLTGWQSIREAIYDLDGYDNTGFIRSVSQYDHDAYPCAWTVDYEHGWYWPALGQLNILYGSALKVNESLQLIGGTLMYGTWVYWSSSVYVSTMIVPSITPQVEPWEPSRNPEPPCRKAPCQFVASETSKIEDNEKDFVSGNIASCGLHDKPKRTRIPFGPSGHQP